MKYVNFKPLDADPMSQTISSDPIDTGQLVKMSAQIVVGAGTASGTLKLQVSNDPVPVGYNFSQATFTNWNDLGSTTMISGTSTTLIAQQDMCYRAMRVLYEAEAGTVTNTIGAIADTGVNPIFNITTPSNAGSTNGDYFILFAPNNVGAVGVALNKTGGGAPPTAPDWVALDNDSKVFLDISGASTNQQVAELVAAALEELAEDAIVCSAPDGAGYFTATILLPGMSPLPVNHNANGSGPGSIVTSINTQGVASNLSGKYFLIYTPSQQYFAWIKVGPTDEPVVPGFMPIEIQVNAGDSADDVGSAMRDAFGGYPGVWTTTGLSNQAVLTNVTPGTVLPARDSVPAPTGFTFLNNLPSALLTVNIMGLSI